MTNLNVNTEAEGLVSVAPHWWPTDPDGGHIALTDAFDAFTRRVGAIGSLLWNVGPGDDADAATTGTMLCDLAADARMFVKCWSAANRAKAHDVLAIEKPAMAHDVPTAARKPAHAAAPTSQLQDALTAFTVTDDGGGRHAPMFFRRESISETLTEIADVLGSLSVVAASHPEAIAAYVTCAQGADATSTLLDGISHALLTASKMVEDMEAAQRHSRQGAEEAED